MRVPARLGGELLRPEPRSLRITGTVPEWERWTGLAFPESGEYSFPRGLAPGSIDREADRGTYFEPNVWIRLGSSEELSGSSAARSNEPALVVDKGDFDGRAASG